MKAIVYAGILSLLAAFTMSCKSNSNPDDKTPQTDDSNLKIFQVTAKSALPTSSEDEQWDMCFIPKETPSPYFVPEYIYKYESFLAYPDLEAYWPDDLKHGEVYLNLPDKLKDNEWKEKLFGVDEFYIDFAARSTQFTVVASDSADPQLKFTFLKIAEQNNDTKYNGFRWKDGGFSYIPTQYVNIECEQNYNAAHPAGTVLNDIATVEYYSAEPFIRSGYKNIKASDGCWFANKDTPLELLNEFNKKQVNMISQLSFCVRLIEQPTEEGVYTFKLTYKDISGEVRTATTIPIRLASK